MVDAAVDDALAAAHRTEWGQVLAATVRVAGDLDLAEECVQEAYVRAVGAWSAHGVPRSPGAWLTTVARRCALDAVRRDAGLQRRLPLLVQDEGPADDPDVPDERLRLVFTCCHPALAPEAQVALTLRLLCGLSTAEVAHAFLVSEPTMAARITRAKKKIAQARIPYRVPPAEELPERVDAVLAVVHLVLTTGHTAPDGDGLVRQDLVARALELARVLHALLPLPEVSGLLALVLLTDARRATRTGPDGRLLLLAEQDRSRWDRAQVEEGLALTRVALRERPVGRYALQAAIAAVHAGTDRYEDTDWDEVAALYGLLQARWPSPVIALNRAVALGLGRGPRAGLDALDPLLAEPALAAYPYLPAARADFLGRLGRRDEAAAAYRAALALTTNAAERDFLTGRLAGL